MKWVLKNLKQGIILCFGMGDDNLGNKVSSGVYIVKFPAIKDPYKIKLFY